MSETQGRLGFWGAFAVYGGGLFLAGSGLVARSIRGFVTMAVLSIAVGTLAGGLAVYWSHRDGTSPGHDDDRS